MIFVTFVAVMIGLLFAMAQLGLFVQAVFGLVGGGLFLLFVIAAVGLCGPRPAPAGLTFVAGEGPRRRR
jgi:hypothetical protein